MLAMEAYLKGVKLRMDFIEVTDNTYPLNLNLRASPGESEEAI